MGEENGEEFELGMPINEDSGGSGADKEDNSNCPESSMDTGSPKDSRKKRGSHIVVEPQFDEDSIVLPGVEDDESEEESSEVSEEGLKMEPSGCSQKGEDSGQEDDFIERENSFGVDQEEDSLWEASEDDEPPEPETSSSSEPVSEKAGLSGQIEALSRKFDGLQEDFEGKLKYDAYKDKLIDSLHRELQSFKSDLVKKHVQSMIMDIVKVIDDLRKLSEHYSSMAPEEIEVCKLLDIIDKIPSDLEDVFFYQGVKPFVCNSDEFDPRRQRVLKRLKTSDPLKDKTIAESIRPGYEWEGRILRPEMVAVYVCNEPPAEEHERNSDE